MIHAYIHKKLDTANGTMLLDIQLDIKKGQFVTLYGSSGVGKTSVLSQ